MYSVLSVCYRGRNPETRARWRGCWFMPLRCRPACIRPTANPRGGRRFDWAWPKRVERAVVEATRTIWWPGQAVLGAVRGVLPLIGTGPCLDGGLARGGETDRGIGSECHPLLRPLPGLEVVVVSQYSHRDASVGALSRLTAASVTRRRLGPAFLVVSAGARAGMSPRPGRATDSGALRHPTDQSKLQCRVWVPYTPSARAREPGGPGDRTYATCETYEGCGTGAGFCS
jgi:hypothetical protein